MTAQTHNRVVFEGNIYRLLATSGDKLPAPLTFGIEPRIWSTANRRGYITTFICQNNKLLLNEFHIGYVENDNWKPINNIKPEIYYREGWVQHNLKQPSYEKRPYGKVYSNLNIVVDFSGGILIGNDFIQELYSHGGFQETYKFKSVYELLFQNGTLTQSLDQSLVAAQWRDEEYFDKAMRRKRSELRAMSLPELQIQLEINKIIEKDREQSAGEFVDFVLDYY